MFLQLFLIDSPQSILSQVGHAHAHDILHTHVQTRNFQSPPRAVLPAQAPAQNWKLKIGNLVGLAQVPPDRLDKTSSADKNRICTLDLPNENCRRAF